MFAPAVRLDGTDGFNEPRVAVDNQGRQWVIANAKNFHTLMYRSDDGGRRRLHVDANWWRRTPTRAG